MNRAVILCITFIFRFGFAQISNDTFNDLDLLIHKTREVYNDQSGMSIIVTNNDSILYEKHTGNLNARGDKVTNRSAFYIASTSKALIAALTMKLHEKGILSIDAPISEYLPRLDFDSWFLSANKLTLKKLLSHQSHLKNKAIEIRTSITGEHNRTRLLELFRNSGYQFFGNTYSNLNYILIGLLLEEITGKQWKTLIREELIEPLQLRHTYTTWKPATESEIAEPLTLDSQGEIRELYPYMTALQDNTLFPSGGIIASARDLAKLLRIFLNGQDKRNYLTEESIQLMIGNHGKTSGNHPHDFFGFGLGFELALQDSLEIITQGGSNLIGARSYLGFSKELNIGISILSNENIKTPFVHEKIVNYLWKTVAGRHIDKDKYFENLDSWKDVVDRRFQGRIEARRLPGEPKPAYPDPVDRFAGQYYSEKFGTVNIYMKGNILHLKYGNLQSILQRMTRESFVTLMGPGLEIVNFSTEDNIVRALKLQHMDVDFKKR